MFQEEKKKELSLLEKLLNRHALKRKLLFARVILDEMNYQLSWRPFGNLEAKARRSRTLIRNSSIEHKLFSLIASSSGLFKNWIKRTSKILPTNSALTFSYICSLQHSQWNLSCYCVHWFITGILQFHIWTRRKWIYSAPFKQAKGEYYDIWRTAKKN